MSIVVNGTALKSATFNGQNVDKALFTIAVERALSSNQRQKAKTDSSVKTVDFVPCSLLGAGVSVLSNFFSKQAIEDVKSFLDYILNGFCQFLLFSL